MATGQSRDVRIITKKTAVPGRIPTGTTGSELNFIKQGELAQNMYDRKLFGFDGTDVFEFGVNTFLNLTGGTISGNLGIIGNLSANTFYSGSTNLYDIFQPKNKSPYNTYILTAGTSYTFSGTINTLSINKTTGSSTQVNLPSNPSTNDFFIVKDRKGDSKTNRITVSGGTKTIDGSTSYVIKLNNKPSLTFLFDGEEYIVI